MVLSVHRVPCWCFIAHTHASRLLHSRVSIRMHRFGCTIRQTSVCSLSRLVFITMFHSLSLSVTLFPRMPAFPSPSYVFLSCTLLSAFASLFRYYAGLLPLFVSLSYFVSSRMQLALNTFCIARVSPFFRSANAFSLPQLSFSFLTTHTYAHTLSPIPAVAMSLSSQHSSGQVSCHCNRAPTPLRCTQHGITCVHQRPTRSPLHARSRARSVNALRRAHSSCRRNAH